MEKKNKYPTYDYLIVVFGISGIVCALNLIRTNNRYKILVIERRSGFGGVWNDALETSCLQTDRIYYKINNIDYPKRTSRFPNKNEMLNYFRLAIYFLKRQDIHSNISINYNTSIQRFEKINNLESISEWTIYTHRFIVEARHILLCTGSNTEPNIPKCLNNIPSSISDKIYHTKNIQSLINKKILNTSKKLLIVGNGASACDFMKYLKQNNLLNKEIAMIYRSNKYYIDKYIYGIPGSFILTSKFMHFFEKCPDYISSFLILLSNIFVFKNYLDLPKDKINSKNIVGTTIINQFLRNPLINFAYTKEYIVDLFFTDKINLKTSNGIISDIDILINATGYKTNYYIPFYRLYRYTIPVDHQFTIIENVGYFGFNPRYNFIKGIEMQIKLYLNLYEQPDKLLNKKEIKKWILETEKRKKINNLEFLDCTYELFDE